MKTENTPQKTKLVQSIPLLSTFFALIIAGAVLFTFTPADAVLDTITVDPLPVEAAEPLAENQAVDAPVISTTESYYIR